jgi:hypothetical protein
MDHFNALSTATAARKIPPLKDAPPFEVISCALVASTTLEKDLDAAKEVTGGADAPSAKMADRPANSPGRPTMVCGHSPPSVIRVGHHQRTKVPLVPEAVERARLVLFSLTRRLGRSTDRARLHVPLWGSYLRGW